MDAAPSMLEPRPDVVPSPQDVSTATMTAEGNSGDFKGEGGNGDEHIDSGAEGEEDAKECWICRDTTSTPENPLVGGFCRCRGSIGVAHSECINYWVLSQRRSRCPSCGATYNVVIDEAAQVPEGLFREVAMLVRYLYVPLLWKCANILMGAAINGFLVAFVVGCAFHHNKVFGAVDVEPPDPSSNVSTASGTVNGTALAPGSEGEMLSGARLWLSVMLFGWCATALWRSSWTSWKQWRGQFADIAVEEPAPHQPHTLVEYLHHYTDAAVNIVGCSREVLWLRSVELCALTAVAYTLSFALGRALVASLLFLGAVLMRLLLERKQIKDCMRRYDEAQERKREATHSDIVAWFVTYIVEMGLFSFALPIVGGVVIHYSLSPYFLRFPSSVFAFAESITFLRLLLYWLAGTVASVLLMCVETTVIVNLFAPGVDLFFVRSVDLNIDNDSAYWGFILTQIFDADPLRVLFDFSRIAAIEVVALYSFLTIPLYAAFYLNNFLVTDVLGPLNTRLEGLLVGDVLPQLKGLSANVTVPFLDGIITLCGHGGWQLLLTLLTKVAVFTPHGTLLAVFSLVRPLAYLVQPAMFVNMLLVAGLGVAITCLRVFPISRMQLRVMRSIAMFLAVHVHMEGFLFDKERLRMLDEWLLSDGEGELPIQPIPLPLVFLRRERVLPPEQGQPTWLRTRLIVFTVLFFIATTAVFWALPVVLAAVFLMVMPYGFTLVCCTFNAFFVLLDYELYCKAVVQFTYLCALVLLGIPLNVFFTIVLSVQLFFPRRNLVLETFEYCFGATRSVGKYYEEPQPMEQINVRDDIDVNVDVRDVYTDTSSDAGGDGDLESRTTSDEEDVSTTTVVSTLPGPLLPT